MGVKLYLRDLEEIIFETGQQQYHIDNAGTSEFKFTFDYEKFNGWYKEIVLDNFKISYGSGSFAEKTTIFFEFDEETVEMHFSIKGNSSTSMDTLDGGFLIGPNSHNIFYGNDFRGKIEWNSKEMFFLEINLKPVFFEQYLPTNGQFDFFKKLIQNKELGTISSHNHPITPQMFQIINDIINCHWKNEYRRLFLESKVMELLLLQLDQMQQCEYCFSNSDTSRTMIDKMHLARDIIIGKLNDPISLPDLARMVSTNECTLKKEFKNIYGKTVFGYIRDAKMQKAKNLLLHNNLSVTEISEMVGYKNPQHFSSAFKKQFGVVPSSIKS
ncbi:helix-turn-helix transcriptional regulator [Flagellimonas eckloniae]|uniref:helix-turn-helix transcriptional regulator n=1 Tax=Flagellimonas eckloniae TaxID=346185 RepID=UPI0006DCC1BF|nr:AraC family transcriptional regulator [Allomuricauda eckloniae]